MSVEKINTSKNQANYGN